MFTSCREKDGFVEGAFLQVTNATGGNLEIIFDNDAGVLGSLFCSPDSIAQIPMDMHARHMNFLLREDTNQSIFSLDYSIIVRRNNNDIILHLENIVGVIDTAVNDHSVFIAETFD